MPPLPPDLIAAVLRYLSYGWSDKIILKLIWRLYGTNLTAGQLAQIKAGK